MLKIGTICSGIDSPIDSLKSMGVPFSYEYGCDININSIKIIAQNCPPKMLLFEDINNVCANILSPVDILILGLPCNSISQLSKNFAWDTSIDTIFSNTIKIVKKSTPRFVIFENVTNMKLYFFYKQLQFLQQFREIGYNATEFNLDSQDYGLPQMRKRNWIIAFRDEKDFNNFNLPLPTLLKTTLYDFLDENIDDRYYYSSEHYNDFLYKNKKIIHSALEAIDNNVIAGTRNMVHTFVPRKNGIATALDTYYSMPFDKKCQRTFIIDAREKKWRIRKITHLEWLKLQGFSYLKLIDNKKVNELSKDQFSLLYTLIGRSMSCNVLTVLFNQLLYGGKHESSCN